MALIKCSECGSTVSNRATVCPQCGCPINDSSTALQAVVNNSRNKILIILFVSLGILLVGLVGWKVSNAIGKDNIVEIGKAIQGCEELFSFHNGLSCVKQNGKYGFIDKKGKVVVPFQFDDTAYSFSDGLTYVKREGKYGFIDKKGKVIIPFQFDDAESFSDGLAKVRQNDKYGFVDKEGKVVVPFLFDAA